MTSKTAIQTIRTTVAEYVASLGVAGVNIEDSTAGRFVEVGRHAAKVEAVKARCPHVFVNARTDTYWLGQDADVASSLARAQAYVDAGADGAFVPGATDPDVLRAIAAGLPVPVNVLVVPGLSLGQLGALGIRRVSTGSLPFRCAVDAAVAVATTVRDGGSPAPATTYATMQERLSRFDSLGG